MSKATIEYEDQETLKVIVALADYLDFEILSLKDNGKKLDDNLVSIYRSLDSSFLTDLFAEKNIGIQKLIRDIQSK